MNRIAKLFSRNQEETPDDEMAFTSDHELNYDRDPFLHSLNELKPEDIPLTQEQSARAAALKKKNVFSDIVTYVCLAVFIVSCVMLVDNLIQKQRGNALYDEAAAEFEAAGLDFGFGGEESDEHEGAVRRLHTVKADTALSSLSSRIRDQESADADTVEHDPKYNEQLEKLRALLRSYKERNEDVYGYLSIPAAGIEYVVVQGEDNEYYLDHNYKKEYLVIGSIFVDYNCFENVVKNFNTVIYGHNIITNGGAMLHGITKFLEPEVFETGLVYLYTMDGVYIFKPFSIYDTSASSGYIRTAFYSKADFLEFAESMRDRSLVPSTQPLVEDDRIITFSTCTNTTADGRYAMHAVLVDAIT